MINFLDLKILKHTSCFCSFGFPRGRRTMTPFVLQYNWYFYCCSQMANGTILKSQRRVFINNKSCRELFPITGPNPMGPEEKARWELQIPGKLKILNPLSVQERGKVQPLETFCWCLRQSEIKLLWRSMSERQELQLDPQIQSPQGSREDMISWVVALETALLPCLPARELQAIDRSPHPSHQSQWPSPFFLSKSSSFLFCKDDLQCCL